MSPHHIYTNNKMDILNSLVVWRLMELAQIPEYRVAGHVIGGAEP
jgi:hypothetical protein